jgi:hypothetical protein
MWMHLVVIFSFLYFGSIWAKVSLSHIAILHSISHKALYLIIPEVNWRDYFLACLTV